MIIRFWIDIIYCVIGFGGYIIVGIRFFFRDYFGWEIGWILFGEVRNSYKNRGGFFIWG